uniref:Uncharacterized protein n=1 Tax=Oryza brachyantha TaxID=4533 RepID=J3M186_ORYBR
MPMMQVILGISKRWYLLHELNEMRPSVGTVRNAVEEEGFQKRVCACKVFVVGSQRRRVRSLMVFAKRRSTKRQPWCKSLFSDAWGWPHWSSDDVLSGVNGEEELCF